MSKLRSQTIRIFLPTGNPRGIRRVERTSNSNIRLIEIPRTELNLFYEMKEAADMGIYFLVGSNQLYIGQTTDLSGRIKQHDKGKLFWQRAFIVVLNNDFRTLDHLYCLEKTAIEYAQAAGRFMLENGTAGSTHRHLHDSIRSDCENIFDEIDTLLAVLNQNFFEEKQEAEPSLLVAQTIEADPLTSITPQEVFYCRSTRGADAQGIWQENGFLLLKSSRLSLNHVPSLQKHGKKIINLKQTLLQSGVLKEESGQLVLLQDYFIEGKPSTASDLILGRPSSGWREWKNARGQTLDEVYRAGLQTSD